MEDTDKRGLLQFVQSNVCARCSSMTSTLEGLQNLTSDHGIEWNCLGRTRDCTLCELIWRGTTKVITPPRIFAELESSDDLDSSSASPNLQNPLRKRKLKSLYIKFEACWMEGNPLRSEVCSVYPMESVEGKSRFLVEAPIVIEEVRKNIFREVTRSINECMTSHAHCAGNAGSKMPKRVIDAGSDKSRHSPTLYLTSTGECAPYVALSYCWGGNNGAITTTATLDSFLQELPMAELSKSITDAIMVTRGLGIRFLWVDALCIVQDDDDDKIEEINAMGSIYQNSTLTIAAASSDSADRGFLRHWPLYNPCMLPLLLPTDEITTILVKEVSKLQQGVHPLYLEPLDRRGWTLQEFLLSPRVLYFGTYGMTWYCQEGRLSDCFSTLSSYIVRTSAAPRSIDSDLSLPSLVFGYDAVRDSRLLSKKWADIIVNYTRRSLSERDDLLPALAGIAKQFQTVTNDYYLAGMWKEWLIRHLGWRCSKVTRASNQGLPTWSWISSPGYVDFHELTDEDAKLVEWTTSLKTVHAPLGAVVSGTLKILAKVLQAATGRTLLQRPHNGRIESEFEEYGNSSIDDCSYWLLLGRTRRPRGAMVLKIQEHFDGTFTRTGVLSISKGMAMWSHPGVVRRELTIV